METMAAGLSFASSFHISRHREITEPLTLTYCVDNGDDTRTELNRTHLGAVMARFSDDPDPPARLRGRERVVAGELRQLAQKLEEL